jgi:hypothetical protein
MGKNPVFRGANCSSVALEVRRSTPLRTVNLLEQPPWNAPRRGALPEFSPGNSAPGVNPGLKRTRICATFKKFVVKTTFKLKINIKRNPLNLKSIQCNHLQAFPISWDYPFKRTFFYIANFPPHFEDGHFLYRWAATAASTRLNASWSLGRIRYIN